MDDLIQVRREAERKHPCIFAFYFCQRIEHVVTSLLKISLVSDWIWYIYEFQLRRSTHAHGMMKMKVAPNVLELVSKFYPGRKLEEVLDHAVRWTEMIKQEKGDFKYVA